MKTSVKSHVFSRDFWYLCGHLIHLLLVTSEGRDMCTLICATVESRQRKPSLLLIMWGQCELYKHSAAPITTLSDHRDQLAITFPQNPYIRCFTRTSRLILASRPIGKRKRSQLLRHKNTGMWDVVTFSAIGNEVDLKSNVHLSNVNMACACYSWFYYWI